jgi:osmotically-inducible protein OsmY
MSEAAPDRYLVARIREALTKDPRVNEPELEVTLAGDRVMVSGVVPTEERRRGVTEVVRELVPDRVVMNQTTVPPAAAEPNVEELT